MSDIQSTNATPDENLDPIAPVPGPNDPLPDSPEISPAIEREARKLETMKDLGLVDPRTVSDPRTAPKHPGEIEDLVGWKRYLANFHVEHPQRAYTAAAALAAIEGGIATLAGLGHNVRLVEGRADVPVEFPRMVYSTGGAAIVNSREEFENLGPGWRYTQGEEPPPATQPAPEPVPAPPSAIVPSTPVDNNSYSE